MARRRWRRGVSGAEVVIIMAVIVIAGVAATIFFNRISAARHASRCQFNLHAMRQGFDVWSRGHDGSYPAPGGQRIDLPSGPVELTDSTADLHLMMLHGRFYQPHETVCPGDQNPNVRVFADDPPGSVARDEFRADIDPKITDSWSNVSYANQDFVRRRADWRQTAHSGATGSRPLILLSDRGPKEGAADPDSYTYQLHGPADAWVGYLAYPDGRVARLAEGSNAASEFAVPGPSSRQTPERLDNPFAPAASSDDPIDNFLSIFHIDPAEANRLRPMWD